MTAHKFWYDTIPNGFENHRENYRSDMIQPISSLPAEVHMMDDNDYHEHMLLKALDAKDLDIGTETVDDHHSHDHDHHHESLPSLHDDDESFRLIDEQPLMGDEVLPIVTPVKSNEFFMDDLAAETAPTTAAAVTPPAATKQDTKPMEVSVGKEDSDEAGASATEQQMHDSEKQAPETPVQDSDASDSKRRASTAISDIASDNKPVATKDCKNEDASSVASATTTATATTTMAVESQGPVSVEIPEKFDVLCGQSRICANHTGNRRFQVVLDIYAPTYKTATTKQEKMSLTKEIVACISESGGRFLKYKEGMWTEIPNVTARDKVSHALRTKVASWKRQKQSTTTVAAASTSSSSPTRRSRRATKPSRSKSALVPGTSRAASKHRKRRSSTSIMAMTNSFDSSNSNIMDDLLRSQREIFASLTGSETSKEHPLKK